MHPAISDQFTEGGKSRSLSNFHCVPDKFICAKLATQGKARVHSRDRDKQRGSGPGTLTPSSVFLTEEGQSAVLDFATKLFCCVRCQRMCMHD